MNIGIVSSWNSESQAGQITSSSRDYSFTYSGGRTIISAADLPEPELGRHIQPDGFELKKPRIGDVVVFAGDTSPLEWAYAEHYVAAAIRQVPSELRMADSV